jgi:ribosomal protein S18 acetylase RimI-like enzyme
MSRLMAIEHDTQSDYVWQLDLRRENGHINASFREVRLPRPVAVQYPRDPYSLADEWSQRSAVFVALAGEELLGYISILEHTQATTAWITDLVIRPSKRRQGVGSVLLSTAQDWAIARGTRDIFIEMSSKNHPAIRLAQKFGFEFCGYNDHYYVTQDVALFFGRSLT